MRRREVNLRQQSKKEQEINNMTAAQVVNELKDKQLPVYGTNAEKRDRLKGAHGIQVDRADPKKKNSTRSAIQALADNREERRRKMEEKKQEREMMTAANEAMGIKCDVEFQMMVERAKSRVK